MNTSTFERNLESLHARQDAAHDREESDYERLEFARDQAEHEAAIKAANNAPLFNIPAYVWRRRWEDVHETDSTTRFFGIGFWLGAHCAMAFHDENYGDSALLIDVATQILKDSILKGE